MSFAKGYKPWNLGMKKEYSVNAGIKHPRWNGGRRIVHGYIRVYAPNHPKADIINMVAEHRLIMEKHIGRYLEDDEIVHHKNSNKSDNRIENLQLMKKKDHHIDRKGFLVKAKCPDCNKEFDIEVKHT